LFLKVLGDASWEKVVWALESIFIELIKVLTALFEKNLDTFLKNIVGII
jgi:hypothetical protein